MQTIPAQEIKRRGIGALDSLLANAPVHILKNNRPEYVVVSAKDYQQMLEDLALARIEESETDLREGRIKRGSAEDLMRELRQS